MKTTTPPSLRSPLVGERPALKPLDETTSEAVKCLLILTVLILIASGLLGAIFALVEGATFRLPPL